jgi:protein tyrosine phosphatase (PTP) superfamily phosphohydrolase (DUF442 family)
MSTSTATVAAIPAETRKSNSAKPIGWIKLTWWGLFAGTSLALATEVGRLCLTHNLHTVIPGRVYRSAQLTPDDLEDVVRFYDIRTVVNLRGCSDPLPWYVAESRKTHELQIQQADICLSAGRMPSAVEMRRLVRTLDQTEYPILLHCYRGADRTGMASAIVLLLQTEAGFANARGQLGLRYGHAWLGRPAYLDQFLDSYAEWLEQNNRVHSSALVREWLEYVYAPADCRCRLETLQVQEYLTLGVPSSIRVRCRNTGSKSWHLRPATNAGTHVGYQIWEPDGACLGEQRSGIFDAVVAPEESIDVTLPLPALHKKGRHHLFVDMVDEQHCWFHQTGSEPMGLDVDVR